LPERARELFGRGGKLFITYAADGSTGSIRTLIQSDGDIVTRATEDSIDDDELIARHRKEIQAWLDRLNRDWASAEGWLSVAAATFGTVFLGVDLTSLYHGSALQDLYLLLPAVPFLLRGAVASVARRRFLRAD
jgi:hypothetical protein